MARTMRLRVRIVPNRPLKRIDSRAWQAGPVTDSMDRVVRARRAVVDGAERAVSVGIRDGRIAAVAEFDADFP